MAGKIAKEKKIEREIKNLKKEAKREGFSRR